MRKVKILLITLILILGGTYFSYVNADQTPSSQTTKKTLQLKFSKR